MSLFHKACVAAFLCCGASVFASSDSSTVADFAFDQEKMWVSDDTVYIISSFDTNDAITAYDHYGTRLWNANFHAKIVSWQIRGNYIFAFSKSRAANKTYLTCLSRFSGGIIWER